MGQLFSSIYNELRGHKARPEEPARGAVSERHRKPPRPCVPFGRKVPLVTMRAAGPAYSL